MPSYVGLSLEEGSGILDPVIASGSEFSFYGLSHKLEPDLDNVENKIIEFRPTHILLAHYFGWSPKNQIEFLDLASSRKVEVIHDFAHSLWFLRDASRLELESQHYVFSIHKTLATNAGGASITNLRLNQTIQLIDLSNYAASDVEAVFRSRIDNTKHLYRQLIGIDHADFYLPFDPTSPQVNVPLNLPVLFHDAKKRHRAYAALVEKGITPTALYHRLVPQIDISEFPLSGLVSGTILNLPTHQDMDLGDLDQIVEILTES